MNRIGTTIAATFIAATTAQAQIQQDPVSEDVFNLGQSGAWSIELEVFSNGLVRCNVGSLSTQVGELDAPFYVTVDAEGVYTLYWMVRGATAHGRITMDVIMRVGRTTWTLHDAPLRDIGGAVVFMFVMPQGEHHEFLSDFSRGNDIQIDYDDGDLAELWSLHGSADAIRALKDCQLRIQPTY